MQINKDSQPYDEIACTVWDRFLSLEPQCTDTAVSWLKEKIDYFPGSIS